MKILYITTVPSPYKVQFFEELGKLCDLTVIFELKNVSYREEDWMKSKFINFKYLYIDGVKLKDKIISTQIISHINKNTYDLIIIGVYSTISQIIAQIYMRFRNINYIISSDGGLIKKENKLIYRIKKFFISSASAWLSTGEITNRYLIYYGAKKNKIYKYPFTSLKKDDILDAPIDYSEKIRIREKLNIDSKKMIISVGQFIHRKGYDILLKSCQEVSDTNLYIIGGKPTQEYLEIKEKYRLNNVYFLDFMKKEDLAKYYKAADFFVLPTREDIWGLVINEAMSYGLPIITTNKCVAGLEMVTLENGIIINSNNVKELVNAIKKIFISDLELMSKKSIQVSKQYTIENMAIKHYEIFKEILEKKYEK